MLTRKKKKKCMKQQPRQSTRKNLRPGNENTSEYRNALNS